MSCLSVVRGRAVVYELQRRLLGLEQLRQGDSERTRKVLKISQRRVPSSEFNACEVHPVDVRFLGKTLLGPALLGSQLSNALGKRLGRRRRWGRWWDAAFRHSEMLVGAAQLLNKL